MPFLGAQREPQIIFISDFCREELANRFWEHGRSLYASHLKSRCAAQYGRISLHYVETLSIRAESGEGLLTSGKPNIEKVQLTVTPWPDPASGRGRCGPLARFLIEKRQWQELSQSPAPSRKKSLRNLRKICGRNHLCRLRGDGGHGPAP